MSRSNLVTLSFVFQLLVGIGLQELFYRRRGDFFMA